MKKENSNQNLKVHIKDLCISVAEDVGFDIYRYFRIKVPEYFIKNFDPPFPFTCILECTLVSKHMRLSSPIKLESNQYFSEEVNLPQISIFKPPTRILHHFKWDSQIEFPINYYDLPFESMLQFNFYVNIFPIKPLKVLTNIFPLFNKNKKFKTGPFILTFDQSPKTTLQKHLRRVYKRTVSYDNFNDPLFNDVSNKLHPKDAELFFNSVIFNSKSNKPPQLSSASKYLLLNVIPPDKEFDFTYHSCKLDPVNTDHYMNPIQRLSSDLSESLESIPISEIFSKIKSMPPYSKDLTPFQENFIYNHLDQCLQDQEMYPMLFRTINWNDKDESTNIASQLATCEPVDTEYALEFLTKRYERKPIRDLAIRSLLNSSITELQLYIPQLVQAIKSDLSIDLSELLLNKSREDVIFATKLFWIVRIERNTNSTLHSLYQSLKELYHSEFKKQEKLIEDINELMVKSINTNNSTPETIRRKVIELLNSDQFKSLRELDNVRLPLNPKLIAVGIDPNSIKVFQSSRKPIRITFLLNDNTTYRVIFKLGDDMRQDQLIIQLFEVMDNILYKSAMSMPITAYNTLAFSTSYGCCECIENSMAIQDIKDGKSKFHSIREFLEEDGNDIDKKIEIFKKSCSVYCVMTYIVMVGDRHDNNILVANDGRLIHIDFGFIFGEDPKPFAPPLKLSDEMINTIGDDGFEQICNWAEPAFKSLREHARLILTLIELMNTCEPPLECFEKNNPMNILRKVEKSFLFDCNANEASQILKRKLRDSKNSTTMKVIDAFHTYAINKAAA